MSKLDFASVQFCGRQRELQVLREAYLKASSSPVQQDEEEKARGCDGAGAGNKTGGGPQAIMVGSAGSGKEKALGYDTGNKTGGGPQAVMVVGCAGSGKSALVSQFRQTLPQSAEDVIWIQAKVEEGVAPLSEMVVLCNGLVDQLCSRKDVNDIRESFERNLSSEINILETLVPSIAKLRARIASEADGDLPGTCTSTTRTNAPSRYSLDQIRYSWRALLRATSDIVTLVVVADDIHFLNEADFHVIGTLIQDQKTHNMMLIGTCRSLEDGSLPPKLIDTFQSPSDRDGNAQFIELSNLGSDELSEIMQRLLVGRDRESVAPLVEVVMRKTAGNPLFTLQFLRILEERGLIYYSTSSFHWKWKLRAIESEVDIADNVVDLLMNSIRTMKEAEQLVLVTAACFGLTCFDLDLLQHAVQDDTMIGTADELVQVLARIAAVGLIEDLGEGRFKFSHDRIRESSVALLPSGRAREEFHLSMGMRLLKLYDSVAADEQENSILRTPRRNEILLRTVIQLNLAAAIITDSKECVRFAELNHDAAKLASNKSAYFLALEFLKAARSFLEKNKSAQGSQLSVSIQRELAFLCYCCGNIDDSLELVEIMLSNACITPEERREAKLIQVKCLVFQPGAEAKILARDICISELQALGISWPQHFIKARMLKQFFTMKRKLSHMSDEDFSQLPTATNERELIDAVQFLDLLGNIGVLLVEDDYRPLAQLAIMKLTFKHGRLVGSKQPLSYILASWGFFLARSGKLDEANRFGRLALKETQREEDAANPAHAAAVITHYSFISIWKRPWAESLDPLVHAIKVIAEKDVANIYMGSFYFIVYFSCGMTLPPMVKDFAKHVEILQEHSRVTSTSSFVAMISPMAQFFDNLIGTSTGSAPTVLQGAFISNQDKCIEQLITNEHHRALQFVFFSRMMLGYYFYDFDLAKAMASKLWKPGSEGPSVMEPLRVFFRVMIACQLARMASTRAKKRKYVRKATKMYIDKYFRRLWVEKGAINCLHMLLLLQAEVLSLNSSSVDKIRKAYDEAISAAAKIGSLSMRALGNERIGVYFRERGDSLRAKAYLTKARDLYVEWGAHAKVDDMNRRFKECSEEGKDIANVHLTSGGSLRARSRLDDMNPLSISQHKAHVLNALVEQR